MYKFRGKMNTGNLSAGYRAVLHLFWAGITGFTVALLFFCPGHCQAALKKRAETNKTKPVKTSEKVREFQERLNRLLEPVTYKYVPAGKPDPFQPFIQNKPQVIRRAGAKKKKFTRPDKCATPLECMDVGQLRLVAIVVEDTGENIAMAQDASGIGYILKKGTRVGFRNGHVIQILPDRIVVQEEAENIRGEMTLTNRVLFLHPEEK